MLIREMRGFEYDLINEACKAPQLFLVGYYERHSSTRRDLKRAFYILDGTIYVAPSLYNVLSSRIVSFKTY